MQTVSKVTLLPYKKTYPNSLPSSKTSQITSHKSSKQVVTSDKNHQQSKLYTFCSSQVKQKLLTDLSQTDQNISITHNQDKTNSSGSKPKLREKSKSRGQLQAENKGYRSTKEKKKLSGNFSGVIQPLNSDHHREQRRINIDLQGIKPKYFDLSFKKQGKGVKEHLSEGCIVETGPNGIKKIVIDQNQLRRFTQKFAKQKIEYEQVIQKLQIRLNDWEEVKKSWEMEKKDFQECMNFSERQREQIMEQNESLERQLLILRDDIQYYLLAKQQWREILKNRQGQAQEKERQLSLLREQLAECREGYQKQMQQVQEQLRKQCQAKVAMLQIQVDFLSRELEIGQNRRMSFGPEGTLGENSEIKKNEISSLEQANRYLSSELSQMYHLKAQNEALRQALQISNNSLMVIRSQLACLQPESRSFCASQISSHDLMIKTKEGHYRKASEADKMNRSYNMGKKIRQTSQFQMNELDLRYEAQEQLFEYDFFPSGWE